jgi:hypothetical protein
MTGWTMRFDIETNASPEQVRHALTDFTQDRLRIWNRTLDTKTYQVREQGPTWAVARESTPRSPFWVVARYDWSEPTVVRWTVVESSYGGGGQGSVRIAPRHGGGSQLHAEWVNTEPRRQKLMLHSVSPRPEPDDRANVGRRAGPIRTEPGPLTEQGEVRLDTEIDKHRLGRDQVMIMVDITRPCHPKAPSALRRHPPFTAPYWST